MVQMVRSEGRVPLGLRVGVILMIGALVFPLLGVAWAASTARRAVERQVLAGQQSAVASVLHRVTVSYDAAVRGATSAAERPGLTRAVADRDAAGARTILANVRALGFFAAVAVYDGEGRLVAADPPDDAPRPTGAPPDAVVVSEPRSQPGGAVILVEAPFRENGVIVGSLVATIPFRTLAGGAEGLQLPGDVTLALVDRRGFILASVAEANEGLQLAAPKALAQVRDNVPATATYFAPRLGYRAVSTFVPSDHGQWSAIATSPEHKVFADADTLTRRLWLGGVLLVALGVALSALVARYVGGAEARLRAAQAQAEAQNEALAAINADLDAYANVAAHDLKSPLTTIRGFADLVLQVDGDRLSDTGRQALETVTRQVDRMARLIDALLAYAKAGSEPLQLSKIELDHVVAEVRTRLRSNIEERSATVEVSPLPSVVGDETLLAQVFQNLIANGLNYGNADGPRVTIEGRAINGVVEVAVRDNGPGVDAEDRDRIFDMFVRGSAGRSRPGAGIGLALSRRVVERHGGTLTVDTDAGGGAVFVVQLPNRSE